MATRRLRHILTAGLAALVALGATGCGDDDGAVVSDGETPAELLAASADRLDGTGSAHMDMVVEMTGLPEPVPSFTLTAAGDVDLERQSSVLTMDLGEMGAVIGLPSGGLEIRVVDDVAYMPADVFGAAGAVMGVPAGVEWVSIDYGIAGSDLGITSPSDFTELFDQLRSVSDEVEDLGTDDLDGVTTTRYRAHVDLGASADQVPDTLRGIVGDDFDALRDWVVPVDVWLDGDGLPRRLEMLFDMGDLPGLPAEAAATRMQLVLELSDFGVDVVVEAPPDDVTFDLSTLLSETALGS